MALKTYNVKYSRFFPLTGKRVTETLQADANTAEGAKRKVKNFIKKTTRVDPKLRIIKCTLAKRKKPSYLRI